MKKINITTALLSTILIMTSSCDMDIVPNGNSTLGSAKELEYLLNNIIVSGKPAENIGVIVNECYGQEFTSVSEQVKNANSIRAVNLTYDTSTDRAALATRDNRYTAIYSNISNLNIIIGKIYGSDGDESLKKRVCGEACLLRAYMHYLAVNLYAGQYDGQNASQTGGVAYVDSYSVADTKPKLNLDEVYEKMLDDCRDEYIESLPLDATVKRCTKATGYAIKAKILFQMKKYSEALGYALKCLELNDHIEDRSIIAEEGYWDLPATSENNLIYISAVGTSSAIPNWEQLSLETVGLFEDGDYTRYYAYDGEIEDGNEFWNADYGYWDSGIDGCLEANGYDVYLNPWGITVERMMYLAAECYIRNGDVNSGLALVNKVREKRIHPDYYQPLVAQTEKEAMESLQKAKFIECIGSYENFFDRKRWNSETEYRKDIVRHLPDIGDFTISYDSPLWIQPFPVQVIQNNPSFSQNF